MKRPLNIILTALLIVGLIVGIFVSVTGQIRQKAVLSVRGVIGSEKEAFFRDPAVSAALKTRGLMVTYVKAGSRDIATRDLNGLDFAFPAGTPAADALKKRVRPAQVYDVFYTPLVIASFDPVVKLLTQNGMIRPEKNNPGNGYGTLDLTRTLKVMTAGTRWNALKGSDAYPSSRGLLISTTDVRSSNSAAMYLALVSAVLNGNDVAQANVLDTLMPKIAPLFLRQGYQESSSAGPFEDYQALGAGKTPLVAVYESQYLAAARAKTLPVGAALLYPSPGIFTKHVLVPLTPAGERLGEALSTDPELQRLAARAGYRTRDAALFLDEAKITGESVPATLLDTVDLPSQEVLEAMIRTIQSQYPK